MSFANPRFRFQRLSRPVTRVFIHCSASDNPDHDNVATMDAWHKERGWSGVGYHLFCRKSGLGEYGRSLETMPAAQRGHNRGSIAICLHGLEEGAFTAAQTDWLISVCQQINAAYRGNVTFHGHCEVAAKSCPVIDYREILGLDEAGRMAVRQVPVPLAEMVGHGTLSSSGLEEAEAGTVAPLNLQLGDVGPFVRDLQTQLAGLGYHVGAVDGRYGPLTRDAVLAFQADNHLVADGWAGRATFEALEDAEARAINAARAGQTVVGLAAGGSRIAQASVAQGAIGTILSAGGALSVLEESTGTVTRIAESVGVFQGVLGDLGPFIGAAVVLGGVLVVLQAMKAGRARRDDHRQARTL